MALPAGAALMPATPERSGGRQDLNLWDRAKSSNPTPLLHTKQNLIRTNLASHSCPTRPSPTSITRAPSICRRRTFPCAGVCRRRSRRFWRAGRARICMASCAESGKGRPQIRASRRASLRERQCPHRHGAQQNAERHRRPLASDDGPGIQLRARLGLSWAADRMEGRGGILPQQRQVEARFLGFASHHRLPQGMPRLCRTLALRATGGVQAVGRRRRLGSSLHDDELSGRSADRPGNLQICRERAALSRLEAGDVERRREDGACGGRGRIRRPCQRHDFRCFPS